MPPHATCSTTRGNRSAHGTDHLPPHTPLSHTTEAHHANLSCSAGTLWGKGGEAHWTSGCDVEGPFSEGSGRPSWPCELQPKVSTTPLSHTITVCAPPHDTCCARCPP
eukprot:590700-Rhodomonas_salina.1